MSISDSSWTQTSTVDARPSNTGSPHPEIPSSVSILRKHQRGGTLQVLIADIFIFESYLGSLGSGRNCLIEDSAPYDLPANK